MNIDELAAKTTDKMKSRIDKVLSYINKMNKRDQVMFLLPITAPAYPTLKTIMPSQQGGASGLLESTLCVLS